MTSRIFLIAGLLAAGLFGTVPAADAASKRSAAKQRDGARSYALEYKHRARAPRIPQPRGPAYIYDDYPYYYSRGHYPTHIVRYIYYPPSIYSRSTYARYGRCSKRNRGCVSKRGACKC